MREPGCGRFPPEVCSITTIGRRLRNAACAGAAAVALASCAARAAGTQRDPQTLVVVEPSDANTVNPLFSNNQPSFLYWGFIFEGLGVTGPGYSTIPALGTGWTHTPDALHWTVALRRNARWSDGAPFTPSDVVFTWKLMLDPAVGYPYSGLFSYVGAVTAIGPDAVRFDLKTRNALFESQALTSPILPEHILAKIPASAQRTSSFGEHPIGTGPYQLERWQHDDTAVFVRNPFWWHAPAKIRRLQFRIVLNDDARLDALEDGSADLADNLSTADYRTLTQRDTKLNYVHLPGLYSYFIATNLRLPGISELPVRQAMMYAWDRRRVTEGLLHGDAIVDNSFVAFGLPYWHDANVMQYPYDPQRARALLSAAGWEPGADGVRRKGRRRLAFVLSISTGSSDGANVAAEFQADMRAAGIEVTVKTLDYGTFIDNLNNMNYELAYTAFGGVPDPDEYTFLDSSQVAPAGNNMMDYRNAIVDRDLVAGLQAIGDARRKPYYDELQRITAQTLPVLWGWDSYFRAAYTPRLHIDRSTVLSELAFWWNVYDWTLSP